MATVGSLAHQLNISPQTVRTWTEEFAAFLSPSAVPPRGQPRHFTADDVRVIALIARMRQRLAGYEEIHEALAAGERAELPTGEAETDPREGAPGDGALLTRLSATVARYEGELGAVREERDYLRKRLETEQEARLAAERRAVEAETELRIMRRKDQEE
ncbi:MAG: MerR family transcriptional regulator [Ardenticatenales bacterium]|nr:MerR family transcriptional regulator [Ardenticatenales bacterium]